MYLEKIAKLIGEFLPENWLELGVEKYSVANTDEFVSRFYRLLNLSLLSGEHFSSDEWFKGNVGLFLDIIKEYDVATAEGQNFPNHYNDLKQLLVHLSFAIFKYSQFSNSIKFKLSEKNPSIDIANIFAGMDKDFKEESNQLPYNLFKDNYDLFDINLKIALVDHNLDASIETFNQLAYYITLLNQMSVDDFTYLEIIIDKASILLQKVFWVIKIDYPNIKLFDGLGIEPNFIDREIKYFSEFKDRSIVIADEEFNKSSRELLKNSINKFNDKVELDFFDYLLLFRYAHQVKKPKISYLEIMERYESEMDKVLSKDGGRFDKKAYQTTYLYFRNNHLSYLIKNLGTMIDVSAEYEDIVTFQEDTSSVNYFPYLKFSEYLVSRFEMIINEYDSHTEIKNILNKLTDTTNKLSAYSSLSNSKKMIPLQATLDECSVNVNFEEESISLFLFSSYFFPLNFSTVKNEVDRVIGKLELLRLKSSLMIDFHNVEIKFAEANTQLKDHSKTQIEILSIFAAIVLFVASNIQLFPKFSSLKQALLFTVTEAYCLGLFVTLIWFVTRGNLISSSIKRRFPWTHFWLLLFFAVTTAILISLILTQFPDIPLIESCPK